MSSVSLLMGVESNSGTADARAAVTWPSTGVAARLNPLPYIRTDRRTDRLQTDTCTVAKRCVIDQKLLLTAYIGSRKLIAYEESIGTKMDGGRASIIASHSPLNISEQI